MGKKVYTIEGKMYIIDDETGDIKTIRIESETISPEEYKNVVKFLVKLADKKD